MGSKYKETAIAGVTTLLIPIGKMVLEMIFEKLSKKRKIQSSYEDEKRAYIAARFDEGGRNRDF